MPMLSYFSVYFIIFIMFYFKPLDFIYLQYSIKFYCFGKELHFLQNSHKANLHHQNLLLLRSLIISFLFRLF